MTNITQHASRNTYFVLRVLYYIFTNEGGRIIKL